MFKNILYCMNKQGTTNSISNVLIFAFPPREGGLPLQGGHHAHLWTFKMDPKQVISNDHNPPLNKYFSQFSYPNKYHIIVKFQVREKIPYSSYSWWIRCPFFWYLAILTPFPLYLHTVPIREKQPFLLVFLNEHGVHLATDFNFNFSFLPLLN